MFCIAFRVVVSAFRGSKLCAVSFMNSARLARTGNHLDLLCVMLWSCVQRVNANFKWLDIHFSHNHIFVHLLFFCMFVFCLPKLS